MLIAASVIISMRGYAGTSITNTWLIRRSVRRPVAEATTASISSSVCRLPFISASTSPARANATARSAAAWLCGAATIRYGVMSMFAAAATARIFASGPTSIGTIRPRFADSIARPANRSRRDARLRT